MARSTPHASRSTPTPHTPRPRLTPYDRQPSMPRAELGIHGLNRWTAKCLEMSRNAEFKQPETVRARRPPLPGARWPSRSLAWRIALVQGNAQQGPPTLRHQCQLVQEPLSLELNRRLVVKSRLSEIFSAVNASVGPPAFFRHKL